MKTRRALSVEATRRRRGLDLENIFALFGAGSLTTAPQPLKRDSRWVSRTVAQYLPQPPNGLT